MQSKKNKSRKYSYTDIKEILLFNCKYNILNTCALIILSPKINSLKINFFLVFEIMTIKIIMFIKNPNKNQLNVLTGLFP